MVVVVVVRGQTYLDNLSLWKGNREKKLVRKVHTASDTHKHTRAYRFCTYEKKNGTKYNILLNQK